MTCQDPHGRCYMEKLIENYPKLAGIVLDRSTIFSDHHPEHPDFTVTYDYQLLEEKPRSRSAIADCIRIVTKERNMLYFAPQLMANFNRENLLVHPITASLFTTKWNRICKQLYYASFIMYIFFVIALSTLILLEGRT